MRFGRYCGNSRWMQSWIVTTDGTRAQQRTHVVRRVEQVGAEPPQLERDRDVLAQPVACGEPSTTGTKFSARSRSVDSSAGLQKSRYVVSRSSRARWRTTFRT